MKLTLDQLRRIIKEEVTNAMTQPQTDDGYEWFVGQPMDSLTPGERRFVRIALEKGDLVLAGANKVIQRPA